MKKTSVLAVMVVAILLSLLPAYCANSGAKTNASPQQASATQTLSETPLFTSISMPLYQTPMVFSWGDYDNDGCLDFVQNYGVYQNQGGSFTLKSSLNGGDVPFGAAWSDFDNDGDLDVVNSYALFNSYSGWKYYAYSYKNNGSSTFAGFGISLPGNLAGSVVWGDYNNDGKLDFYLCGTLFKGNGTSSFTTNGSYGNSDNATWIDYDNDGDLDLASAGKIYRNNGNGTFTVVSVGLPSSWSDADWGDYDNDGDLDVVMNCTPSGTKIYRNDNGVFVDIGASLISVSYMLFNTSNKCVAWGDFDNDGDLDLAVAGLVNGTSTGKIYRNDNGSFIDTGVALPKAPVAWGDYDGDGDLDLFAGNTLFRNNSGIANTVPSAPTGLWAKRVGTSVTFNWSPATDVETPTPGLSYNLRVGTAPGKCDILSGMALASGKRLIPAIGNAQKRLSWTLKDVPAGPIYWSVQAIDSTYAGSPWATEKLGTVVENIKRQPNDATVSCGTVVVTAVFGDSFYIEETGRTSGIRVDKAGHGLSIGDARDITGEIKTDLLTGERYISATTITGNTTGSIYSLAVSLGSLGGGQLGLQEAVKSQKGGTFISAAGLNNIGLLVKVYGKVTQKDPSGQYFYIDDGSALSDGTMTGDEANIGVRVSGDGTSYDKGQFLTIKGISSCFKGVDGSLLRLVKPVEVR